MRTSVAAALALLLGGLGVQAQQPVPPPQAAACAACHGPGGNSPSPDIPSIAGQPKVFIENQLVLIREGLREVPSMKPLMDTLDDAAISALARHYAAQPAITPPRTVQAAKFSAGAAVSKRALCGTCHLPDYSGQNQIPRLAGQQEAYLAATMKMYRDNPAPGRDTAMSAALHGLSDADLSSLAHYFALQGR